MLAEEEDEMNIDSGFGNWFQAPDPFPSQLKDVVNKQQNGMGGNGGGEGASVQVQ